MSEEKTLITHARTSAARFLNYEITVRQNDQAITNGQRSSNGTVRLRVPAKVIKAKCAHYMKRGNPRAAPELMNMDDYTIVSIYGAEYRGIVQYYLLASDVYRLNRLNWVMETSMLKTLARQAPLDRMQDGGEIQGQSRHPIRAAHVLRSDVERDGGRKPLVARYGGIPLRAAEEGRPAGPSTRSSGRPQGTDYQTPCEPMRDLRALGKRSSAPYPKARGPRQVPRQVWPDGYAGMGGDHGETAAQGPCSLPILP